MKTKNNPSIYATFYKQIGIIQEQIEVKKIIIFWIYILVSVANLTAQVIASYELARFTKPVLMPLLLYYVYESSRGKVTMRILLLGLTILLFWIGDVIMMYQAQEIYFMAGIALFLLAHGTYIVILNKSSFQPLQFDTLKVLPFAVYAVLLLSSLLPYSENLKIPVLIYGIVISVMVATARLREGNTEQKSYRLALYGSILFLCSDSLLAIDKFYEMTPMAGLWIMCSRIVAQLLLVEGILRHTE